MVFNNWEHETLASLNHSYFMHKTVSGFEKKKKEYLHFHCKLTCNQANFSRSELVSRLLWKLGHVKTGLEIPWVVERGKQTNSCSLDHVHYVILDRCIVELVQASGNSYKTLTKKRCIKNHCMAKGCSHLMITLSKDIKLFKETSFEEVS